MRGLVAFDPHKLLHCYAWGRHGAWEVICLDLDIAAQGQSFEDASQLLREAIGLHVQTVNDLPEVERAELLSRPVPFSTRLGFAIEVFWSPLRAKSEGEFQHYFTMAPLTAI